MSETFSVYHNYQNIHKNNIIIIKIFTKTMLQLSKFVNENFKANEVNLNGLKRLEHFLFIKIIKIYTKTYHNYKNIHKNIS